jgi:signal transduction histidine kinase
MDNISSESLGINIMRERAEAIGANLKIASDLGHGVSVTVIWPAQSSEKAKE